MSTTRFSAPPKNKDECLSLASGLVIQRCNQNQNVFQWWFWHVCIARCFQSDHEIFTSPSPSVEVCFRVFVCIGHYWSQCCHFRVLVVSGNVKKRACWTLFEDITSCLVSPPPAKPVPVLSSREPLAAMADLEFVLPPAWNHQQTMSRV